MKIGDEVYVWDRACMPKKGVVTELNAITGNCIRVDTGKSNQVYIPNYVYKNLNSLVCNMRDYAFDLDKKASELEVQIEEVR